MIVVSEVEIVGTVDGHNIYKVEGTEFLPFDPRAYYMYGDHGNVKPPYYSLQKYIANGYFYFSPGHALTLSTQQQHSKDIMEKLQSKVHLKYF